MEGDILRKRAFFFVSIISLIMVIFHPVIPSAVAGSDVNRKPFPLPAGGRVLFEDTFQDNSNNWLTEENQLFGVSVENGRYTIEQKVDGGEKTVVNYQFDIPTDVSFKIEALVEKIQGNDDYGYGLIWGSLDVNNQNRFYVSGNGNYSAEKRERGKSSEIIAWSKYGGNGKQTKNRLAIVKHACFTYFYVNDEYLDKIQDLYLYGGKTGFVIQGRQKISVDYVSVTAIEGEEAYKGEECPVAPEIPSPEATEEGGTENKQPGPE